MNRAVFLDRDGILNRVVQRDGRVTAPWNFNEFQIIEDAEKIVEFARSEGYLTIVATNQPDISHGRLDPKDLARMNQNIKEKFKVDAIEVCTSSDNSEPRRKPNPGMLQDASQKFNIILNESYFIGDSAKDIQAGKTAGVKTILLQTDYNREIHGTADFNCNSFNDILQILKKQSFSANYLNQVKQIVDKIDPQDIENMVSVLAGVRDSGGRLFLIGSGGGAGNASHATCDFRKLCGFEAYCPTDNISELTARINDDGWDSSLANYLKGSKLRANDCLMVFSVGGGSAEKNISANLVKAMQYAQEVKAKIVAVIGRDGGYSAKVANACLVVPTVDNQLITPHTESFQAVAWHLIISHPALQINRTKWESSV